MTVFVHWLYWIKYVGCVKIRDFKLDCFEKDRCQFQLPRYFGLFFLPGILFTWKSSTDIAVEFLARIFFRMKLIFKGPWLKKKNRFPMKQKNGNRWFWELPLVAGIIWWNDWPRVVKKTMYSGSPGKKKKDTTKIHVAWCYYATKLTSSYHGLFCIPIHCLSFTLELCKVGFSSSPDQSTQLPQGFPFYIAIVHVDWVTTLLQQRGVDMFAGFQYTPSTWRSNTEGIAPNHRPWRGIFVTFHGPLNVLIGW